MLTYDPATAVWTNLSAPLLGTPPSSRYYHGFASDGDKLYVHGGTGAYTNKCEGTEVEVRGVQRVDRVLKEN